MLLLSQASVAIKGKAWGPTAPGATAVLVRLLLPLKESIFHLTEIPQIRASMNQHRDGRSLKDARHSACLLSNPLFNSVLMFLTNAPFHPSTTIIPIDFLPLPFKRLFFYSLGVQIGGKNESFWTVWSTLESLLHTCSIIKFLSMNENFLKIQSLPWPPLLIVKHLLLISHHQGCRVCFPS